MNVDEAWRRLGEREAFPRDALQWSLDHWEEAGPRFLAKLRAFASGAKFGDDEREALFWTIHLCAEKRDERAYAPLCRILAEYAEVWDWLGDALTELLHGILINVFDGDVEPLKQVVASSKADASSRSAALMTLGYLVRARGVMSDDEMRAYLGEIEDSVFEDSEGNLGFAWAFTIAALGYDSMMPAIARALSRGALYDGIANFKDYHADLQRARQDPDRLAAFRHEHVEPFGSTIDTFEPQARERERREQESLARNDGDLGSERGYVNPETPYINPLRTVGRNDPCPCGSGKKYKKCCLAA